MKQYYSYTHFKNDTNILMRQLVSHKFDAILGIARGGLCLSHCVAEGLGIRNVQTLRTELYDGSSKRKEISLYGNCDFKGLKKVLVLDDIADSGETLKVIMDYLETNFKDVDFKSATLFYKTTSIYEPHFWVNEANNWIDFFWERDYLQV